MLFITLALCLVLLAKAAQSTCAKGLRVRKEFRDLSPREWARFKSALFKLYTVTIDAKETLVDRFTRVYLENGEIAEDSPYSLPWKRYFLQLFENELRKFDPDVTVPYWVSIGP